MCVNLRLILLASVGMKPILQVDKLFRSYSMLVLGFKSYLAMIKKIYIIAKNYGVRIFTFPHSPPIFHAIITFPSYKTLVKILTTYSNQTKERFWF